MTNSLLNSHFTWVKQNFLLVSVIVQLYEKRSFSKTPEQIFMKAIDYNVKLEMSIFRANDNLWFS